MAFLVCGRLSTFPASSISCGVQAGRPSTAMSFFHSPGEALGGILIDPYRLLSQVFFLSSYVPFYDPPARAPRHSNTPAQQQRYPADQLTTSLSTKTENLSYTFIHADQPSTIIGISVRPFTQYVRLLTIFTKEASKPTISRPSQKNHIHRIEKD